MDLDQKSVKTFKYLEIKHISKALSTDFFCTGPASKHFTLCGPYSLCYKYLNSAVVAQKWLQAIHK